MDEKIPTPQIIEDLSFQKNRKLRRLFLVLAVMSLALFFGGLVYYSQKTNQHLNQLINNPSILTQPIAKMPADKVIAKTGQESIYQQSVDNQIALYPSAVKTNQQQAALDQLIKDSIILQMAKKEGLTKLSEDIFNSQNIDLKKRAFLVEKVKKQVETQADTISGSVISIWFLNDKVGPLGYEAAKKMAREKIEAIYTQVKSGKITMAQAAALISQDTSLAQLDPAYKSNAYFKFTINKDGSPTHSDQMNQALKELPVGKLTEIFTIKSEDINQKYQKVDAYYSFGSVTSKTGKGLTVSFDDWFEKAKKEFKVETF